MSARVLRCPCCGCLFIGDMTLTPEHELLKVKCPGSGQHPRELSLGCERSPSPDQKRAA